MGSYRYLMACAAGLMLAGLSLVSSGPSSGGLTTRFLNIPAVSFVGRIDTAHNTETSVCGSFVSLSGNHGDLGDILGRGRVQGSFIAPVFLPQGATVTALSLFASDLESATNQHAYLVRKKTQDGVPVNGRYAVMAQASSSGNSGFTMRRFADETVSSATIDNSLFAYFVELVGCGGNQVAVSARITYTTP
jgi:hypothetical protein